MTLFREPFLWRVAGNGERREKKLLAEVTWKPRKAFPFKRKIPFISPSCKSALYLTHWNIILIISGYLKESPYMFIFPVLSYEQARIIILQFNEVPSKEPQVNSKRELDSPFS